MNKMSLSLSFAILFGILHLGASNIRPKKSTTELTLGKLTLAEWPSYNIREPNGPGTYAYGYEVEDAATGNIQFKDEEKLADGTVKGSYGHVRPDGLVTVTKYVADQNGYRASTETYKRPGGLGTVGPPATQPTMPSLPYPTMPTIGSLPGLEESSSTISAEVAQQILNQHQIELNPTDENLLRPDISAVVNGFRPLPILLRDKNTRFSLQLVNNFIPSNFPIVAFMPQNQAVQSSIQPQHDPVETSTFVNDRFHDPIETDNFVNDRFHEPVHNVMEQARSLDNKPFEINTKEAIWYRDFIKNQRQEYLQKYAMADDYAHKEMV